MDRPPQAQSDPLLTRRPSPLVNALVHSGIDDRSPGLFDRRVRRCPDSSGEGYRLRTRSSRALVGASAICETALSPVPRLAPAHAWRRRWESIRHLAHGVAEFATNLLENFG